MFDVDSKDLSQGMSCPPSSFLESTVLKNIKQLIGAKGLFILNLVCRDEELRNSALTQLHQVFPSICCYKLDEDINEVIYCSNDEKFKSAEDWKKVLGTSCRNLNTLARQQKLVQEDLLDVTEFLNDLKL